MTNRSKLTDLVSVGPAIGRDLNKLGIIQPEQLKGQDASELYARLQVIRCQPLDPCCREVFQAAIAQVENPDLPHDQKQWFYWSGVRKG